MPPDPIAVQSHYRPPPHPPIDFFLATALRRDRKIHSNLGNPLLLYILNSPFVLEKMF